MPASLLKKDMEEGLALLSFGYRSCCSHSVIMRHDPTDFSASWLCFRWQSKKMGRTCWGGFLPIFGFKKFQNCKYTLPLDFQLIFQEANDPNPQNETTPRYTPPPIWFCLSPMLTTFLVTLEVLPIVPEYFEASGQNLDSLKSELGLASRSHSALLISF